MLFRSLATTLPQQQRPLPASRPRPRPGRRPWLGLGVVTAALFVPAAAQPRRLGVSAVAPTPPGIDHGAGSDGDPVRDAFAATSYGPERPGFLDQVDAAAVATAPAARGGGAPSVKKRLRARPKEEAALPVGVPAASAPESKDSSLKPGHVLLSKLNDARPEMPLRQAGRSGGAAVPLLKGAVSSPIRTALPIPTRNNHHSGGSGGTSKAPARKAPMARRGHETCKTVQMVTSHLVAVFAFGALIPMPNPALFAIGLMSALGGAIATFGGCSDEEGRDPITSTLITTMIRAGLLAEFTKREETAVEDLASNYYDFIESTKEIRNLFDPEEDSAPACYHRLQGYIQDSQNSDRMMYTLPMNLVMMAHAAQLGESMMMRECYKSPPREDICQDKAGELGVLIGQSVIYLEQRNPIGDRDLLGAGPRAGEWLFNWLDVAPQRKEIRIHVTPTTQYKDTRSSWGSARSENYEQEGSWVEIYEQYCVAEVVFQSDIIPNLEGRASNRRKVGEDRIVRNQWNTGITMSPRQPNCGNGAQAWGRPDVDGKTLVPGEQLQDLVQTTFVAARNRWEEGLRAHQTRWWEAGVGDAAEYQTSILNYRKMYENEALNLKSRCCSDLPSIDEMRRASLIDRHYGGCFCNDYGPSNIFFCYVAHSVYENPPTGFRFVEQGRGVCTDSNGADFTRITYEASNIDACRTRCSDTGLDANVVGLDYGADHNSCNCRLEGVDITSGTPGEGNCPSGAHAYWSRGSSCANAAGMGPVTGVRPSNRHVCLRRAPTGGTSQFRILRTAGENFFNEVEIPRGGTDVRVKQCRDGEEFWSGEARIWISGEKFMGQRHTGRDANASPAQWLPDDQIVPPSLPCSGVQEYTCPNPNECIRGDEVVPFFADYVDKRVAMCGEWE